MLKSSKIHSLPKANSPKSQVATDQIQNFEVTCYKIQWNASTPNLPALLPYRTRRWTCRWTASGTLLQLLPLFRADNCCHKDSFHAHSMPSCLGMSWCKLLKSNQMQLAPSRLSRLPVTLSTWWFLCINAAQVPAWSNRCRCSRHGLENVIYILSHLTSDRWLQLTLLTCGVQSISAFTKHLASVSNLKQNQDSDLKWKLQR